MNDPSSFGMDFSNDLDFKASRLDMLDPPLIEVYLAGSLTNNDPVTHAECGNVRNSIKELLHDYDHLGLRFQVYDPADVTQPGSQHTAEEVYEMDHQRTMTADVVFFHVNVPSLGVGCESQISADATVPRVTISKKGSLVSRMFTGVFGPALATIEYDGISDLKLQISKALPEIAAAVVLSARRRRPILATCRESNLGRTIFKQRIIMGISIAQLAVDCDIKESWLRRLERDPSLSACCTTIQLARIAEGVQCHTRVFKAKAVELIPNDESNFSEPQRTSLENLVDFVRSRNDWLPDDTVVKLWSGYLQEEQAARHRDQVDKKPVSSDGWRKRLNDVTLFE